MNKTQLEMTLSMLEADRKSLKQERDTYRDLCAELLNRMRNLEISANSADYCYARNGGNFASALARLKVDAEKARELFAKAESILGEKNGNSN